MNTEIVTITKIAIFKGKKVRKVIFQNEWWFSVVDICDALTDSLDSGAYWRKLKQRLNEEGSEVVTFCHGLKLPATDGKLYETDCANTESIFRIIQSIPSPKAEPFKRWLAKENNSNLMDFNKISLFVKLSTIYRQPIKSIEFNRFKYGSNYGEFATINSLTGFNSYKISLKQLT